MGDGLLLSAASLRFVYVCGACVVSLCVCGLPCCCCCRLVVVGGGGGAGLTASYPCFCLVGWSETFRAVCRVNDGQCVPDRFAFSMV